MFGERFIRVVPEIVLNQAIFWGLPELARFMAERLGKNSNEAEKETYELMAEKNEVMYGGRQADLYRAKARIIPYKSRFQH